MAATSIRSRKRRAGGASIEDSGDEHPSKAPKGLFKGPKSTTTNKPESKARYVTVGRPKSQLHRNGTTPSPSKARGKASPSPKKDEDNKSLHSFFSATSHQEYLEASQDRLIKHECKVVDLTFDDISDGDLDNCPSSYWKADAAELNSQPTSQALQTLKSRGTRLSHVTTRPKANEAIHESASGDRRPWAERFGPRDLSEIAVHKKKVSDISNWINGVHKGIIKQNLLILKGPAGCGKSTTVNLLSKACGFSALEWRNPVGGDYGSGNYSSVSLQFQDFLSRAGKQRILEFLDDADSVGQRHGGPDLASSHKVLLVEEFPNTFARSSSTLQSFQSAIREFLVKYSQNPAKSPLPLFGPTPLILVISETLPTTTSASADSFTAHRLLGQEILNHPATCTIEFNPIAPTFMLKALDAVIQKESRISGRRNYPGPAVLKSMATIGDIRNAIGSLEFLCARQDSDANWSGRVTFGKSRTATKSKLEPTKMEKESLELITQREASLGIFHAVGKVVYNKRHEETSPGSGSKPMAQPPSHLIHHFRTKASAVSLDILVDETGTDISTFIAAVHENYVLSCENGMAEDTLDSVVACVDSLSDGDLMQPTGRSAPGSRKSASSSGFQLTTLDNIRQEELSFHVVTRGILFALPSPVNRKISSYSRPSGSGKGDAFKMFYPASVRLWRKIEELQAAIDSWSNRMMNSPMDLLSSMMTVSSKAGTVESWRTKRLNNQAFGEKDDDQMPNKAGPLRQDEIISIQLPYLAKILKANDKQSSILLQGLRKLVSPRELEEQISEVPEDDDENTRQIEWSTDKALDPEDVEQRPSKSKPHGSMFKFKSEPDSAAETIDRLVLSDDDIED
ncbi:MAG: Cell cycle checkpoint protein rad17 [Vezdaea aestivalis]|nr:MAG: Cell cycle checkpoint protein rad17 [Vezdaea aestivalis]